MNKMGLVVSFQDAEEGARTFGVGLPLALCANYLFVRSLCLGGSFVVTTCGGHNRD